MRIGDAFDRSADQLGHARPCDIVDEQSAQIRNCHVGAIGPNLSRAEELDERPHVLTVEHARHLDCGHRTITVVHQIADRRQALGRADLHRWFEPESDGPPVARVEQATGGTAGRRAPEIILEASEEGLVSAGDEEGSGRPFEPGRFAGVIATVAERPNCFGATQDPGEFDPSENAPERRTLVADGHCYAECGLGCAEVTEHRQELPDSGRRRSVGNGIDDERLRNGSQAAQERLGQRSGPGS